MRRRELLVSTVALGALPGAALAAPRSAAPPTVDVEAVTARVGALRKRMGVAGERTAARYQRQLRAGVELPAELWTTIREGFGAFSVIPSLRRMRPEEQALPVVQDLLLDVVTAAGACFLTLHGMLGRVLSHPDPQHRSDLGGALARLADHDEDEEFGRTGFLTLRAERGRIRDDLARSGPDAYLARLHAHIDAGIAQAHTQLTEAEATPAADPSPAPVDGAPQPSAVKFMARGLATLAGIALLGVAVMGAGLMVSGVLLMFTVPECMLLDLLVAILGGLIMVTAGAAGFGLVGAGRPTGVVRSLTGDLIRVEVDAGWKWFSTGAQFGETQPRVVVEGSARVPGRITGAGPRGLPGTVAGSTAPAPGLPEYALVGRVGDWTGLLVGAGDVLRSAPRAGELWLAVNVPAAVAAQTDGSFIVTIFLRK